MLLCCFIFRDFDLYLSVRSAQPQCSFSKFSFGFLCVCEQLLSHNVNVQSSYVLEDFCFAIHSMHSTLYFPILFRMHFIVCYMLITFIFIPSEIGFQFFFFFVSDQSISNCCNLTFLMFIYYLSLYYSLFALMMNSWDFNNNQIAFVHNVSIISHNDRKSKKNCNNNNKK